MVLAAAAAFGFDLSLALLLPFGSVRLRRRAWWSWSIAVACLGACGGVAASTAAGLAAAPGRMTAEAAAGAALGFALLNLGPTSRGRRVVAAVTIPCLALAAVGFLATRPAVAGHARTAATSTGRSSAWGPIVGQSGTGYAGIARLSLPPLNATSRGTAPLPLRSSGEVGSVVIPAVRSQFHARPAIVYLPPAALVAHPPRLPVVIALSGQSRGAGPQDVVSKGHLPSIMDAIARRHHGVAPIVVIPDQLGPRSGNPMCVDSPLGHVATYIAVDVRHWVLTHLPVAADRLDWTIAGFSEGGTCAIQFGASRPDLFGSLIDVSGEQAPLNGTLTHTIAVGFHGDPQSYAAAGPFAVLASHRYRSTSAYFTAGALDRHYGPVAAVMAAHARRAGMTVHYRALPRMRHNWLVGHGGLEWGLDGLQSWWPAERGA